MRILTFNVWQLPVVSLVGPRRRRARLASALIERVAPDIVVLNESFGLSPAIRSPGYQRTSQVGRPGGAWTSVSGRRGTVSRVVGGGIWVLSRYPIGERHQHVYRAYQRATSDRWSNKGVALVSLAAPVGRIWLAATHLQADTYDNWHLVRMAQLAELRALVDRVVPAGEPVLIAGDLNIFYHRIGAERVDANRILGGRIEPDGPIHSHTFDSATNPLVRGGFYREVLDYVGGVAGPWHILTRTLGYRPGEEISDHFPVLAEVTLGSV
jgi:endonuclease/exonuclease/phosphatase family metal-dependent hydrolase